MKGKVNCTCGWSWNKSDSSKKDMYICHECGRDNSNNMKNGGWLDNYNDSQASAPEGMVGDGYSNVGRNYSPAWGGQFEEGGEIHMAEDGTKKPIYVSSKDDSRYKSYADSLYNYNLGNKLKGAVKSIPSLMEVKKGSPYDKILQKKLMNSKGKGLVDNTSNPKIDPRVKTLMSEYQKKGNKGIMPIRYNSFIDDPDNAAWDLVKGKAFTDMLGITTPRVGGYNIPEWKKPQQEVIVKPTTTKETTKPKPDKKRDKLTPIQNNIKSKELVEGDINIKAEVPQIKQQVRQPKYYDVEDYTQGSTNYNGNQTNYRTSDLSTLSEQSPNNSRKITPHYQMGGNIYPVNYVPQAQMGMSMPGATGSMYARIGAPSKGPRRNQTDVTDASAQNGKEMQYYQNGLDWKPKTISRDGSVIKDDRGQWDHPGEITEINSNDITMEGVPYDVLGISDTGDTKLMKPGKNYKFKGKKVTEFPMAKDGIRQEQKGLVNLDQLTNFTNYNTKQPGGWLNKYN